MTSIGQDMSGLSFRPQDSANKNGLVLRNTPHPPQHTHKQCAPRDRCFPGAWTATLRFAMKSGPLLDALPMSTGVGQEECPGISSVAHCRHDSWKFFTAGDAAQGTGFARCPPAANPLQSSSSDPVISRITPRSEAKHANRSTSTGITKCQVSAQWHLRFAITECT